MLHNYFREVVDNFSTTHYFVDIWIIYSYVNTKSKVNSLSACDKNNVASG